MQAAALDLSISLAAVTFLAKKKPEFPPGFPPVEIRAPLKMIPLGEIILCQERKTKDDAEIIHPHENMKETNVNISAPRETVLQTPHAS